MTLTHALTVAFWPAAAVLAPHAAEAGLQWLASSKQYATPRQHLCEAVERYASMAFAPARLEAAPVAGGAGADKYALREARRGAVGPRATIKSVDASTLALVDREAARLRSAAALHDLCSRLTAAAAAEPHIAETLLSWAGKVSTGADATPPEAVAREGRQPPARLASKAWPVETEIPTTPPVAYEWRSPRWPPGVPTPKTAAATYKPGPRREQRTLLRKIAEWNSERLAGREATRPVGKSWSEGARFPWFRGRKLHFGSGAGQLVDERVAATPMRMEAASVLYALREYPHRQLVSFCTRGVVLHDGLPLRTTLAANLLSFYDAEGGGDAIADEVHQLKESRGWLMSSASTPCSGPEGGAGEAGGRGAFRFMQSPIMVNPRGMVDRKVVPGEPRGPPRGVAELGYPHPAEEGAATRLQASARGKAARAQLHAVQARAREDKTCDTGEDVISINQATGHAAAADAAESADDAFWLRFEGKPTIGGMSLSAMILWLLANAAATEERKYSVLMILFDYKYFFHAFSYMWSEVWKMGCAVPARKASGGAHASLMDMLTELVMSMGWTRASMIAQDLANALMWILLRDTDVANAGLILRMRSQSAEFDRIWRLRMGMEHDAYGTAARIVAAAQYTDDSIKLVIGAEATCNVLVCFSRMVGPRYYPGGDAGDAARGTVARTVADAHGTPLQPWRQITPLGAVVRVRPDAAAIRGAVEIDAASFYNPLRAGPSDGGQGEGHSPTQGYACWLASTDGTTWREVATLCGLGLELKRALPNRGAVRSRVQAIAARVRSGTSVAVRGGKQAVLVRDLVEQACDVADEEARGPPADPVEEVEPPEAYGINLEAAKAHKWHLGSSGIWVGAGLSLECLVVWITQEKVLKILMMIRETLEERIDAGEYSSLVGMLADVCKLTGGGWYRMRGLSPPLTDELVRGKGTKVRLRTHMAARLKAWRKRLVNEPGSPMTAVVEPVRTLGELEWVIGGDAASEPDADSQAKQGLGGWFYGIWWRVALADYEGMAEIHITALELIETGLGVVIVAPLIPDAKRVRIASDAIAAALTLQAARKDVHSMVLTAVHELIMETEEWKALHTPITAQETRVTVEQTYGDTRLLDDACSRGYDDVVADVASALGIQATRLEPLPERAHRYLERVVRVALEAKAAATESRVGAKRASSEVHGSRGRKSLRFGGGGDDSTVTAADIANTHRDFVTAYEKALSEGRTADAARIALERARTCTVAGASTTDADAAITRLALVCEPKNRGGKEAAPTQRVV